MSTRTEVQIDRCFLFHWITLCSFSVRTVTNTSKTASYQLRRSSIKKLLGEWRIHPYSCSNISYFHGVSTIHSLIRGSNSDFPYVKLSFTLSWHCFIFHFFSFLNIPNVDFNGTEILAGCKIYLFFYDGDNFKCIFECFWL